MAKPLIVKRNTKGSALTFTELDANFQNLDDATFTLKAGSGGTDVVSDLNGTITLVAVDGISITGDNTAKTISLDAALAKDLSPELAGDLNVQTFKITTSVSNGNIEIDPPGTGKVIISGDLQVDGTTTTINSTTLDVDDINITIAKGAATAAAANGGGITLEGPTTAATFTYASSDDSWNFNKRANFLGGPINITSNSLEAFKIIDGSNIVSASAFDNNLIFTNGAQNGSLTLSASGFAIGGNAGSILIGPTTTGDITVAPGLTGNINLDADTVRVGDSGAAATITTNGAGNLVINTNAGTNAGSITLAQGTNGNITVAPNGTGLLLVTGLHLGVITPASGSSPITGRHQAITSGTTGNYSFIAQKNRTDILLAAMTSEPAVIGFEVRDSAAVRRAFARMNATYVGTGSNPFFLWQSSVDDFTTTVQHLSLGGGTAVFGSANSAYTLTTNGTANLTLNTNSGTNAGSIVLANGVNGNITVTPNGTGQTVITNLNYNEVVYTAGTTTGTITPDTANGTIQSITLTGSITFNAFTSPISGETLTLIITQPASGGPYTLTSTMKFAGGSKTLSTAANAVDILTVSYIGTTYYANLAKAFA